MQAGIILLAAGNSSRLGQSKQLVEVRGIPLLRRSAEMAVQTGYTVVVVLGADAETHQPVLAGIKTEVIINHNWHTGMGGSLKVGLKHLLKIHPAIEAVLIMVCDQPYLSGEHLQKLTVALQQQPKPIVASAYANVIGVPAIFRKEFFNRLLQLDEDAGAKKVIQQFADQVYTLPFEKGEIDLDTPRDLQHLPNE